MEREIPACGIQGSFSGGNSIRMWIPYSYPINLLKVLNVGVITVLMILRVEVYFSHWLRPFPYCSKTSKCTLVFSIYLTNISLWSQENPVREARWIDHKSIVSLKPRLSGSLISMIKGKRNGLNRTPLPREYKGKYQAAVLILFQFPS